MQHRTRAIWILVLLGCGFTLISSNLVQIQLVQHDKFWRMAIENHTFRESIPPERGAFYDADGNILAQTQRVYDIHLDCAWMQQNHPDANLPRIAEALNIPAKNIVALYNPHNKYALLAHEVDDATAQRLKALKLDGVIEEGHDHRSYPNSELAAHVLGFTDDKGEGIAGMEKEMDAMLRGTPGERWVERDAKKRDIPAYQQKETPAVDGNSVTLTIRSAIQHVVEEQLDQIVQTYSPQTAYIMIMDPQTGEIMAMGSRPTFDPNDSNTFKPERTRNRCITDPVEPGSVFKIITLSGAINEHLVDLQTPIFCENGVFTYAGRELHDDERLGWLPVEEVLAKSSNIGFAKIALTYLHEQKLYQYAMAFGMGQRTHLFGDQGESPGLLRPVNKWSGLSITRVPMGQEVLATPVQLVTAMSVIANGGKLMEPHIIKQVTDPSGHVVKTYPPKIVRPVITSSTARAVAEALHQVTVDGTAKDIKIQDPATGNFYSYAGKTGTAQKWINGEYSHDHHVASFIGFAPAQDPAFVALVMVDDPKTKPHGDYGSQVSAPVFANLTRQISQILNIPPDVAAPPPTQLSAATSNHTTL